jgi:hypothetical protein
MLLYGELTKVEALDDGSIRVHGVASTGGRDSSGEIVQPEAMRKAVPAYLAFGAIREMHQPRAAGCALSAEVGEDGVTRLAAHVVDPVAIGKVKAGVYKGLSIGGKVLARDPDDPTVITALRLDEISLVDRPCNPEAVIDLWKLRAVPTNAEVLAEADALAKAAGKPGRRNDFVAAARAKLSLPPLDGGETGRGVSAPPRQVEAPRAPSVEAPREHSHPTPSPIEGEGLQKLQADLTAAHEELAKLQMRHADERDALAKELAVQAAEIERLRSTPRPPRTAGSAFVRAVDKAEDGHAAPVSPDQFVKALDALPPTERAHLLMKAALARPLAL